MVIFANIYTLLNKYGSLKSSLVINESLKYWLKVFKQEEEIVVNEEDMFLVIKGTREDIGSEMYDVFTSIQRGVIEYITEIRKLRDQLIFEREIVGREHEKDIAEWDIFKGIQEVWVEAMSRTTSTAISRVVAEIKLRKVEEGNQQLKYEGTKSKQRKDLKQFDKTEVN